MKRNKAKKEKKTGSSSTVASVKLIIHFQLHGYFEYIRRDVLVSHIQPQDELQLVLSLTITFDTVTKSSQTPRLTGIPEARPAEIARDLEAIYKEGRLTDFTIVAGDRELPAHQVILSARSPVFAAMLEPHTDEAKNSRVVFRDIDFEVLAPKLITPGPQTVMFWCQNYHATYQTVMQWALLTARLPRTELHKRQLDRVGVTTEQNCISVR
ncbi:unnamed protein product [Gongylonema pulchrum]|uniref:BTB domain-containing protein n=1 Tax=Gongylonema pulchrum TaxID=637853 RepID=A0A183DZ43_9BILA|nr:unnamed protein product [Gongylonema pulchrum]